LPLLRGVHYHRRVMLPMFPPPGAPHPRARRRLESELEPR